mgnify:FL=1|jgi:predicted transcriptional regulator
MVEKCRKRDGIMANVSKTKEYAIRYLKEVIEMENKQIAKELKVAQETVDNILGQEKPNKATIKTATSKTDSFIRETAGKKTNNVTIMTQAASELSDSKPKSNTISSKYTNAIKKARG